MNKLAALLAEFAAKDADKIMIHIEGMWVEVGSTEHRILENCDRMAALASK